MHKGEEQEREKNSTRQARYKAGVKAHKLAIEALTKKHQEELLELQQQIAQAAKIHAEELAQLRHKHNDHPYHLATPSFIGAEVLPSGDDAG